MVGSVEVCNWRESGAKPSVFWCVGNRHDYLLRLSHFMKNLCTFCAFSAFSKDNTAINCIRPIAQYNKDSFPSTLMGCTTLTLK